MKKGWTITKLIATGNLGVLGYLSFIPFMILAQITHIPGLLIITSAFLIPAILIPGLFIIDKFGAAAIATTVLAVLDLPTTFLGPPGFLPKVLLGFIVGICMDILYLIFKRRGKLAAFLIAIGAIFISEISYIVMLRMFSIPGWEEPSKLLFSPLGIGFVLFHGTIGALIGLAIFKRIRNTAIVKRIQKS